MPPKHLSLVNPRCTHANTFSHENIISLLATEKRHNHTQRSPGSLPLLLPSILLLLSIAQRRRVEVGRAFICLPHGHSLYSGHRQRISREQAGISAEQNPSPPTTYPSQHTYPSRQEHNRRLYRGSPKQSKKKLKNRTRRPRQSLACLNALTLFGERGSVTDFQFKTTSTALREQSHVSDYGTLGHEHDVAGGAS